MSREAYEQIVRAYENWDVDTAYNDVVCLHEVSKLLRGEWRVAREDKQSCEALDCVTMKRHNQYRIEVDSGPCDSDASRETLNGMIEGEGVAASKDADQTARGGMTSRFRWDGQGSSLVGRTFAITNAGTHHEPLRNCEECHQPGHAEGWLRAAIVDGHDQGCRVAGSIAYEFDRAGDEGGQFQGTFEGLLICQCND